ncbi:MAG: hypothetical protein P4M14_05185 [Gammaproteobacteria bacterium]|nr:hypothetical protein [Gammaproteobacteria bacterium]
MQPRQNLIPFSKAELENNWAETYTNYLRRTLQDNNINIDNRIQEPRQVLLGVIEHSRCYMSPMTFVELKIPADSIKQEENKDFFEFDNKIAMIKSTQIKILNKAIHELRSGLPMKPPHNTPEEMQQLYDNLSNLSNHLAETEWTENNYFQHICIADHFSTLSAQLRMNPNPTLNEVTASARALENKLQEEPPLNPHLKAAIYGVIGAVVGLVLGVIIGGASTFYAGGFGAFPAAIAAAFKGAALGVTLANVGIGSAIGYTLGLFSSKKLLPLAQETQLVFESMKPQPRA